MSIWSYMNDIELQTLREAYRAVEAANAELVRIDATKQATEERLRERKTMGRRYQALVVARAMGDDITEEIPHPEQSEAELQLLLDGLVERRKEQEFELQRCTHQHRTKSRQTLRECMSRAAEAYREQAQALIESWKQLDAAQLALDGRDLSWLHMFIPALGGMRGSTESCGRACLFDGKHHPLSGDDGSLDSQLATLLA